MNRPTLRPCRTKSKPGSRCIRVGHSRPRRLKPSIVARWRPETTMTIKNRSPTPTLILARSSFKKISGNHGLNQTILQCFNLELTEPQPILSGRSRAMIRNVSSCRGFSLGPKFCFDAPPGKILLVRCPDTN